MSIIRSSSVYATIPADEYGPAVDVHVTATFIDNRPFYGLTIFTTEADPDTGERVQLVNMGGTARQIADKIAQSIALPPTVGYTYDETVNNAAEADRDLTAAGLVMWVASAEKLGTLYAQRNAVAQLVDVIGVDAAVQNVIGTQS